MLVHHDVLTLYWGRSRRGGRKRKKRKKKKEEEVVGKRRRRHIGKKMVGVAGGEWIYGAWFGSGWIGGALRRIKSGGLMEEKRARAFLHEPKCYLFIF